MANRITTIFDFSESGGLKKIKADVDNADTSIGKMKAGFAGAAASIKANAGALAIGAGAAIVTFGVKAAEQFTNLALDVEKFSTATGLSQDAASRWIEVANDLGITTEQIQGGFVKLEKAIGGNSPAVKALGIEMVTAADGTADVSATMLQAIKALEGVKDPAMKAKLASELFGRGFADMAELVTGDADEIAAAMGKVSSAKLINQDEINKAKKNRETLNELKDTFEDITLQLGESFLPVMEATATAIQSVGTVAGALQLDKLVDGFAKIDDEAFKAGASIRSLFDGGAAQKNQELVASFDAGRDAAANFDTALLSQAKSFDEARAAALTHLSTMGLTESAVLDAANVVALDWLKAQEESTTATDDATEALKEYNPALSQAGEAARGTAQMTEGLAEAERVAKQALDDATAALERQKQATDNLYAANLQLVGGEIAVNASRLEATTAQQNLNAELEAAAGDLGLMQTALDNAKQAQLDAAGAAVEYAVQQAAAKGVTLDSKTQTGLMASELRKLQSEMAPGSPLFNALQGYIDQLNAVPRNISTSFTIKGTSYTVNPDGDIIGYRGPRASGGPVSPGGFYQVGESGKPELFEQNGKQYLIPGDSGQVTPAKAATSTPPSSATASGGMDRALADYLISGIAGALLGGMAANDAASTAQIKAGMKR